MRRQRTNTAGITMDNDDMVLNAMTAVALLTMTGTDPWQPAGGDHHTEPSK